MGSISRRAQAYSYIKQGILSQAYPPGSYLVEETIADQLGISRTPVREALRDLSRDNLVDVVPHRGASVKSLSARDFLDIFDIKIRLEGLCAARAAEQPSTETATKLFAALESMKTAGETGNLNQYMDADEEFHAAIYDAAGNERARHIVEDLNAQWYPVRQGMAAIEYRMRLAVEEHRHIADAVRSGDATAAENAMRDHLTNLRDQIEAILNGLVLPMRGGT